MKRIYTVMAALLVAGASFAQNDTTKPNTDITPGRVDTIKVGNYIIIKKRRDEGSDHTSTNLSVERKPYKPSKISTNWFIFDLGYANVDDKTDYSSPETQNFLRAVPPAGKP